MHGGGTLRRGVRDVGAASAVAPRLISHLRSGTSRAPCICLASLASNMDLFWACRNAAERGVSGRDR